MDNSQVSLKYRLLLDDQRTDLRKGEEGLEDYFRKEHTVRSTTKSYGRRADKPSTTPLQEAIAKSHEIAQQRVCLGQSFSQEERKAARELCRTLEPQGPCSDGAANFREDSERLLKVTVGIAMCSIGDTVALETIICADTKELLGADVCYLWVVDALSNVAVFHNNSEMAPQLDVGRLSVNLDATDSAVAQATKNRKVLVSRDGQTFSDCGAAMAVVCVPLVIENTVFGVVQALFKKSATLQADLVRYVEAFSLFAAVALRNVKEYTASQLLQNRAEVMLNMAEKLSRANLDENVLVADIMTTAKRLMEADRCAIFLVDENHQTMTACFENGQRISIPKEAGIAGHVGTSGETINIPDAYEDVRFNEDVDKTTGYRTQSILCMPVKYEDQIVAVTQLINKKGTDGDTVSFTSEDEDLFRTFDAFIGVCLRNCRAHAKSVKLAEQISRDYVAAQALQRKAQVMLELAQQLSSANLNQTTLVAGIMATAKRLMEADRCSVFLIDENHQTMTACFENGQRITIPKEAGIAGHVGTSGEIVNLSDAYEDVRFNRVIDKATGYRTQSILCMSVKYEDQIVAVTQLINKKGTDGDTVSFTSEDEDLFTTFSTFIGVCLRNCRAHVKTVELSERITRDYARSRVLQKKAEVMLDLAQQLSSANLDENVLVADIMTTAKRLMEADRCAIFLVDENHQTMTACFENGQRITIPKEVGIAGHVGTSGEIVNLSDAYEDVRFNRDVDKTTGYRTQSILCMPVKYEDQTVAVTQLINKKGTDGDTVSFTSEDEDLFTTLSTFIGVCLRNCRMHTQVQKSKRETEAVLKELLNADHAIDKEKNDIVAKMGRMRSPRTRRPLPALSKEIQTTLCMPIVHAGEVAAVIQLATKFFIDGNYSYGLHLLSSLNDVDSQNAPSVLVLIAKATWCQSNDVPAGSFFEACADRVPAGSLSPPPLG